MRATSPIPYILGRLVGPVGLMIQTAYLSRDMDAEAFASFLNLYAVGVVASAFSDGGARHVFFSDARRLAEKGSSVIQAVQRAALTKLAYSGVLALVLLSGSLFGWPLDSTGEALAVLLFGIVMPVGDIGLTGLRAIQGAKGEIVALAVEQAIILAGLVAVGPTQGWTPTAVIVLLGSVGLVRMAISGFLLGLVVHESEKTQGGKDRGRGISASWLRLTLAATAGVVAAQVFHRYPAIALLGLLENAEYSVFVAFLAVVLRGQLLMQGVLHAWYGTNRTVWTRLASSAWRLTLASGSLATLLMAPLVLFPEFWVGLYLGDSFVDAADHAVYAAAIMLVCYPLFVLSMLLQYERRNLVVAVGALLGVVAQFALIQFGGVDRLPVLSYALGAALYLVICFNAIERTEFSAGRTGGSLRHPRETD